MVTKFGATLPWFNLSTKIRIQYCLFIALCLGSIGMDHIIGDFVFKGKFHKRNAGK